MATIDTAPSDTPVSSGTPASSAGITGLPLLLILASFPIAFFSGALVTDVAYEQTANVMWADFSAWLLAVGIALAALAAVVGLIVLLINRRAARGRPVWPLVIGSLLVLVLALFDNLIHSRDGWTSVVPMGLALSAVTVVVTLITAWLGFATIRRPGVVVQYPEVRR